MHCFRWPCSAPEWPSLHGLEPYLSISCYYAAPGIGCVRLWVGCKRMSGNGAELTGVGCQQTGASARWSASPAGMLLPTLASSVKCALSYAPKSCNTKPACGLLTPPCIPEPQSAPACFAAFTLQHLGRSGSAAQCSYCLPSATHALSLSSSPLWKQCVHAKIGSPTSLFVPAWPAYDVRNSADCSKGGCIKQA